MEVTSDIYQYRKLESGLERGELY